jgi:hypothetical protein
MPGYGVAGPAEGTGLLPWSWAAGRLVVSRDFWLTTVRPDGRPHVMPVWACWYDDSLWFSSSLGSRKARNLASGGWASVATGSTAEPVVIEGAVGRTTDAGEIATFAAATNVKYEVDYPVDFYDPGVNGTYRLRPTVAFGLVVSDFTGSPTRWTFAPD